MRCAICKRTSDEVRLFTGIFEAEMVNVCEDCAEKDNIPIIRKPSSSQLDRADRRYSVRERMEIMSGVRDKTEISEEQMMTQGNLARLKTPPKKQTHEEVVDNYYWNLNMARRRLKMTTGTLAQQTGVPSDIIRAIERGIIPKDFETIFRKLESYLGIKMLKNQPDKINFVRNNREVEREILENVRGKIDKKDKDNLPEKIINEDDDDEELDVNDKKKLEKITISDLLGIKKRREARKLRKQKEEEMIDEELVSDDEFEIEEL